MTLTIVLPNDLVTHDDPIREALEAVAIEAYRIGSMTQRDAAKLLGAGRLEFQEVLKRHGVFENAYGANELRDDVATMERLREEGKVAA